MDEETLRRARKADRAAAEAVLGEYYPFVCRATLALTGRADVGNGIIRYVMRQSLRVLPKWERDGEPQRWFSHHTILTARRAARHKPDMKHDTLRGPAPQAKYLAYVRAVRELPPQQMEALVLHDFEGLDLRQTAVAMDCSTAAASNHLQAAQQALKLMAGPDHAALSAAMKRTYQGLAPAEELRLPAVKRYVGRHLWPRRVKRVVFLLVVVGVLAAGYWTAARFGFVPQR